MKKDKMTTVRINSKDARNIKAMGLSAQKILDSWICENLYNEDAGKAEIKIEISAKELMQLAINKKIKIS